MPEVVVAIVAFCLGASVGSFLNVVADRVPAGRSISRPRSFCEGCNTPLTTLDLVPILSYLWLKGRCRYCRAVIPRRLPLVELTAGLLFALVFLKYGLALQSFLLSLGVALLLVLAIIDLERGLILDRILFPGALGVLVAAPFWPELGLARSFLGSHTMLASLLNSVLAGAGAFLLFLAVALVYPGGMGGGDVKLAGLVGLLVGFPGVLVALWLAAVSGGLAAAALLLLGKRGRKDPIPFGPFLALGAVAALLLGTEVARWYQQVVSSVAAL